MLNHFSVSNIRAISNDPNDIGYSYQVAFVECETDGTNKTKVYKVKNTDEITSKINELVNLIGSYNPAADSLEQAKFIKLNQIANQWTALEQAGWNSGQGFSLGITSADVALLVGAYTLAKEAVASSLPVPSIIAMNNSVVNFNDISEMTLLLLRYGAARSQMSDDFAAKRRAVNEATTIEEVEAIQ